MIGTHTQSVIRDILNGKFSGGDTLKVLSAFRVFFCLVFI